MTVFTDQADHAYVEIENIRLTYIPAVDRSCEQDWAGHDVIRMQSYKNTTTKSLHRGAEIPISTPDVLLQLISGLCLIYRNGVGDPN